MTEKNSKYNKNNFYFESDDFEDDEEISEKCLDYKMKEKDDDKRAWQEIDYIETGWEKAKLIKNKKHKKGKKYHKENNEKYSEGAKKDYEQGVYDFESEGLLDDEFMDDPKDYKMIRQNRSQIKKYYDQYVNFLKNIFTPSENKPKNTDELKKMRKHPLLRK